MCGPGTGSGSLDRRSDAVVLVAHGSVEELDELPEFLTKIRRGHAPPPELLAEVRRDGVGGRDYKSSLQELVQARDQALPEYRLVGTLGPDHRKLFQVEVVVGGESLATASGTSKKEAEQDAARAALEKRRR